VAIYDATNSTNDRRQFIRERCEQEGFKVVFIESLCEDKGNSLARSLLCLAVTPFCRAGGA
jgi:hypothetical protein